jgi:hypothetical protein
VCNHIYIYVFSLGKKCWLYTQHVVVVGLVAATRTLV